MFYGVLNANSVFLFHGPADISANRDTHGMGMGGTGAGDMFRINASFINPALSTTIDRVHFSTALSMGNIRYRDSQNNSFRDDQAFLPYFNMVFPIREKHRLGFVYHSISSGNLELESQVETALGQSRELHRASFSLYNAGLFYANANDIVNFGVGMNMLLGHEVKFYRQVITGDFASSSFESDHSFRNPTFNIGLTRQFDRFSAGLSYSLPVELKGERNFKTNTINEVLDKSPYEYPAQLTMGLTVKATELLRFSGDIDTQFWGDTNNFDNSVNTLRTGVGVSWGGLNQSRNFFARLPLRAGISHRNLPFEVSYTRSGEFGSPSQSEYHKIYETAYHFGFSFPLRRQDSYLDFALTIFNRGDADKHRFEENGFLLTVGTQGFDVFRRPLNRKAPREIPVPDRVRN